MALNAFEDSRITEGTMHTGAQHVANLAPKTSPPQTDLPSPGEEVLDGHPVNVERSGKRGVLGAKTLTGASVHNRVGESLGKIEDVMIDVATARIAYAVLSFGGVLGIGNKLFVVPWSALTFDRRENEFILDVDREVLDKAPGFDKDNWPDMADTAWGEDIHRHYGQTPYWSRS